MSFLIRHLPKFIKFNGKEALSLEKMYADFSSKRLNHQMNSRRVSSGFPAVATIEAACIFPVIIYFFLSVFWLFEIFYVHSVLEFELYSIGTEMVADSYVLNELMAGNISEEDAGSNLINSAVNEVYVRTRLKQVPVATKTSGLTTLFSSADERTDLDIVVTYSMKPYIPIPGWNRIILTNHFYSKKYLGYQAPPKEKEEMVYVTRTGEVYHTSLNCRALKDTVREISFMSLDYHRNADGSKYYPCEYCSEGISSGIVYITEFGNRYHIRSTCPYIDTEIFYIPLSEVGNRRKCRFCE